VTAPDPDRDFRSTLVRVNYDFGSRVGVLRMNAGCRCEAAEAVALFAKIDPAVRYIHCVSGGLYGETFELLEGHWVRVG
jgi:hypothetical protein